MKYDVSVVGFGDNVVDIYTHENVQYPGGNCVNLAVYAKMFGAKRCAYMGYFGTDKNADHVISALREEQIELVKCKKIEGENGYSRCTLEAVSYTHLTLPTTSRRQRQMCIRDRMVTVYS